MYEHMVLSVTLAIVLLRMEEFSRAAGSISALLRMFDNKERTSDDS